MRSGIAGRAISITRSEEHTSELQSLRHLVCRLLLEKKKKMRQSRMSHTGCQLPHGSRYEVAGECACGGVALAVDPREHIRDPHPALRFFFFNDTATTEIYTLSLHAALPI